MAKWMFTDATEKVDCPKCKVTAGVYCKTPKGFNAKEPHTERMIALRERDDFNIDDYTVKLNSPASILSRLMNGERGPF